jgi:TrmH family RNA methyltransferase
VLTSPKNPKVTAASRLKKRAFRDEDRRFLVEGAQAVSEALGVPGGLETLFTEDELAPLAVQARQAGVEVHAVSDEVIKALTSTVTPQGLVGVAPYLDRGLDAVSEEGCVPILHEVRDPGNAGTVLRSADAAGAGGVVFTATSVDVYNPKTVRSSAGSLFHLPVVRGAETAEAVTSLKDRGFRVLAMASDGADDLYRSDLSENIIGAAAHDIRSPLTAMKGFGYALEKRWDIMTEEQRAVMLQGIVHDADRMDTILRQLVDAARVVGGNLEIFPEQVNVADLVLVIAEGQRRDPDHPPVEWSGEAVTVFVDPARLKTTILAFMETLVWWGNEGSLLVEAALEERVLHLKVSRETNDLTTEDAEALFIPRRPGQGGGSKIGLFVARGVAEFQGGRVWGEVVDGRLIFHAKIPVGF